jgi:hypothetical protein
LGDQIKHFMRNLTTIEYRQSSDNYSVREPTFGREPIDRFIDLVSEGRYCIRMGSTLFIGTAYYYLNLFYPESIIPKFNINNLATIS